jgi:hypothetical protein
MGIKEKLKRPLSPRDTAKKITDNLIPNTHIGNHTYESLSQELIALCQTKPMFRDGKWRKRANNIRANLLNKISHGDSSFQPLLLELNKIQEMR